MSDEPFLARWSRRKREAAAQAPDPHPRPLPQAGAGTTPETVPSPPDAPPPTLEDVARLTRDADFSRFVAPGVDADVRHAALKKLFSDPHFNVMDGLDTYIDDYHRAEPLPLSMLKKMAQARFLGLLDEAPTDENADLRLQSDDAAGRREPEEGAGGDPGREH